MKKEHTLSIPQIHNTLRFGHSQLTWTSKVTLNHLCYWNMFLQIKVYNFKEYFMMNLELSIWCVDIDTS